MMIEKRTFAEDVHNTDRRIRFGTQQEAQSFALGAGKTRTVFHGMVNGRYVDFVKHNKKPVPLDEFIRDCDAYRIEHKKNGKWIG